MDKFGGRKFLVLLLMLTAGGLADHFSQHGLTTNLAYLMLGLYGAFTAGNVGITLSALKNGVSQPTVPDEAQQDVVEAPATDFQAPAADRSQPAMDNDQVLQALNRLEASMGQVVAAIPPQNQALQFLTLSEQRRQMSQITS